MRKWRQKAWRLLGTALLPVRRPFARKVHATLDRALAPVLQNLDQLQHGMASQGRRLESIEGKLADADAKLASAQACFRDDLGPTLDGVVRDLARLQMQIDMLQDAVARLVAAQEPSLADNSTD
jgi:hypothetical protein